MAERRRRSSSSRRKPGTTTSLSSVNRVQDPEALYQKLNIIGRGSFGKVYKGIKRDTREIVAIKVIDLESAEDDIEDIQKEIHLQSQCDHPNVTRYYGSFLCGSQLWIIMEFLAGGSVQSLMKPGDLTEAQICCIAHETLLGLAYLHKEGKVHRDIKAANILIGGGGEVKLGDFGVSGQLTESLPQATTFVGSPYWMAPEVAMHKKAGYNEKADIWSLGITLMEMAENQPPLWQLEPMRALMVIIKHDAPELAGERWSRHFKDFVKLCLHKDPAKRPSAADLLKHKWIKAAKKTSSTIMPLITRLEAYDSLSSGSDLSDSELTPRDASVGTEWDFSSPGEGGKNQGILSMIYGGMFQRARWNKKNSVRAGKAGPSKK